MGQFRSASSCSLLCIAQPLRFENSGRLNRVKGPNPNLRKLIRRKPARSIAEFIFPADRAWQIAWGGRAPSTVSSLRTVSFNGESSGFLSGSRM